MSVVPGLREWSQLEPESIKLQALDLRNLLVIAQVGGWVWVFGGGREQLTPCSPRPCAQVLAQSVAMDFYSSHVERALETFVNMNLEMQSTQTFAKINKQVGQE